MKLKIRMPGPNRKKRKAAKTSTKNQRKALRKQTHRVEKVEEEEVSLFGGLPLDFIIFFMVNYFMVSLFFEETLIRVIAATFMAGLHKTLFG